MSKYTNFSNNYILKFVPSRESLPWYEKHFSYSLDLGKCKKFLNDTDDNFKKTKVVNFDIIHRQCCGEKFPEEVIKNCETIKEEDASEHSMSDQKKSMQVLLKQTVKTCIYTERVL